MNIRFMEIMIAREGGNNSTAPLFFDGACNFIKELPLPNDGIGIAKVYSMLDSIRQPKKVAMFLFKNDELKKKRKNLWAKCVAYLVCQVKVKLHLQ